MRLLIRIVLTLLIAVPVLLALGIFWALQGGQDAPPDSERRPPIPDGRARG